jgi:hypothetical protein
MLGHVERLVDVLGEDPRRQAVLSVVRPEQRKRKIENKAVCRDL